MPPHPPFLPTPCVSVCASPPLLQEAAGSYLKGILGYEERPLVSTDYINERRSGVVDALSTQVIVCMPHDRNVGGMILSRAPCGAWLWRRRAATLGLPPSIPNLHQPSDTCLQASLLLRLLMGQW